MTGQLRNYILHTYAGNSWAKRQHILIKGRLENRLVAYIYGRCEECHIRRSSHGYILHLASRFP